jgi:hypothetical protein
MKKLNELKKILGIGDENDNKNGYWKDKI